MGFKVPENWGSAIHGDARVRTFCVYTDGDQRIELDWDRFEDLERIVQELGNRHPFRPWPTETHEGHEHSDCPTEIVHLEDMRRERRRVQRVDIPLAPPALQIKPSPPWPPALKSVEPVFREAVRPSWLERLRAWLNGYLT